MQMMHTSTCTGLFDTLHTHARTQTHIFIILTNCALKNITGVLKEHCGKQQEYFVLARILCIL